MFGKEYCQGALLSIEHVRLHIISCSTLIDYDDLSRRDKTENIWISFKYPAPASQSLSQH